MAGTSNFAATGAQHAGLTIHVCSVSACRHTQSSNLPYSPSTAANNVRMADGPCPSPACQKKFVNKMRSELQLAGMNCESSLRKFGMVEPMLKEELTMAGCPNDMVEALLNCSQRSTAASNYLGHRAALATLAEYESCDDTYAAKPVAMQLILTNKVIQHKLVAIQSAVLRLSMHSFPAPGLAFPMIDGIMTYEKSWGTHQLYILKSTAEGRAILALPLHNDNILAAKSSILAEASELAHLQAVERAAYYTDYPGTEALFACGAMKSSYEMLADMSAQTSSQNCCLDLNFARMTIDVEDSEAPTDIRSLRSERVPSKKIASNSLAVDMDKVNAYSRKPYTALTNPWWAAKKA